MHANARMTPNQACMEKEKRRIKITEFLKGQADKGNIPKVAGTYDDSTGKFVSSDPPPPYTHHLRTPQADEPKINKDFQEALQRCENLQILSRLKIDVHNCSWNDVFAQMTKANLDYQKQGEGLKNLMTRLWRAMGRGAENAKPWIELIPGDMGLDALKAGLALCFSVRIDARSNMPSRLMRDKLAQNSFEKNVKVLEAFEEIPFIIIRAEMMRKNFPKDEQLKSRCIQLYETILQAIGTLIGFLLPGSKSDSYRTDRNVAKGFSLFRGRKPSTEQIDATLDTVKGEAEELKRLTEQLWERLLVETSDNAAMSVKLGLENEEWNKQFEKKQDTFGEKQDILGQNQDSLGEKQDIFGKKQDIFGERQDEVKKEMGYIARVARETHEMVKVVMEAAKHDGLDVMNYFIPLLEQREEQGHREGFRAGLEHGTSPQSLCFHV